MHYLSTNDSDCYNNLEWQPTVEGGNQTSKLEAEVACVDGGEPAVEAVVELQPAFVGGVGPMEQHSCMVSDLEFQGKVGMRHGDKLVRWRKQVPDACFGW